MVKHYNSQEGKDSKQFRCLKLFSTWNIHCQYLVQTCKMLNNSNESCILLIFIRLISSQHWACSYLLNIFDINLWKCVCVCVVREQAMTHKCGPHQVRYWRWGTLCQRCIMEQCISATHIRFTALVKTILPTLLYTLLQKRKKPLLYLVFSVLSHKSKTYKTCMYIISQFHPQP